MRVEVEENKRSGETVVVVTHEIVHRDTGEVLEEVPASMTPSEAFELGCQIIRAGERARLGCHDLEEDEERARASEQDEKGGGEAGG